MTRGIYSFIKRLRLITGIVAFPPADDFAINRIQGLTEVLVRDGVQLEQPPCRPDIGRDFVEVRIAKEPNFRRLDFTNNGQCRSFTRRLQRAQDLLPNFSCHF